MIVLVFGPNMGQSNRCRHQPSARQPRPPLLAMSDPMRGKLEALAATQRALLQKIEMLEQQEAEEDGESQPPPT